MLIKSLVLTLKKPHPAEVRFNNDGTRMFVVGYGLDYVNQYDLSTAHDVSTASYNNVRFLVNFAGD